MTKKAEKIDQSVVVSRTDDGTVQLTFTINWEEVRVSLDKSAKKLGEGITVPGFRAGKAPLDVVSSHIPREKLVQETIGMILPPLITKAYKDNNIVPVMYPRIELLHAHDNENWEVRATTAQFPEVKLGDYKKIVKEAIEKSAIWTPGKDSEKPKEPTTEEKENSALRALITSIDLRLPAVLVEEEANHRISNLLSRLEKLGLSLENYLATQKKDPESLRAEYAQQATEALKIELILGKIAEEEKLTVTEPEIHSFGEALMADPKRAKGGLTEEDHANIRTLLLKRKAIESLVS